MRVPTLRRLGPVPVLVAAPASVDEPAWTRVLLCDRPSWALAPVGLGVQRCPVVEGEWSVP